MSRQISLSFLFLLLIGFSRSSDAQIQQRVVDLITGAGIPAVRIRFERWCVNSDLRGLTLSTGEQVTDSNGAFIYFDDRQLIPPCATHFTFEKDGYRFSNGRTFLVNLNPVYFGTTLPTFAVTSAASFLAVPPPPPPPPPSPIRVPPSVDGFFPENWFRYPVITGGMIGVIFGKDLATQTESARTQPLPGSLAGRVVIIKKSDGGLIGAQMLYVSPTQINFVVPDGIPLGSSIVQVHKGNEITHAAFVDSKDIFPSLFSVNANGEGVLAGYVLGVKPDDSRRIVPIQRYDSAQNRYVAAPVEFGPPDERLFLVLYGTGFRRWTDLSKIAVTVGGTAGTVTYAGSQLVLAGLDQINLLLPRTLAGRGEVNIEFKINNIVANTVTIAFK